MWRRRSHVRVQLVEDPDTGDTLLYGMGELHLDVVQRRLRDQFRVTSHFGPLSFSYRESVRGRGVGESEVSWCVAGWRRGSVRALTLCRSPSAGLRELRQ